MKRIFFIFLMLVFMSGCGGGKDSLQGIEITQDTTVQNEVEAAEEELVGIWIPIYEIAPEKEMSEEAYAEKVEDMFSEIADFGITDVFVQVRANCDAIYFSEYFSPSEKYSENGELMFDALDIITEKAHKNKLKIHAWLNPYRISSSEEYDKDNLIFNLINEEDISVSDNFVYIKPSSVNGRRLVLNGVREILEKYDVDGIHIDDYFYPTTEESFDKEEYDNYVSQGGKLNLGDWRRENVNILVSSMYSLVKKCDERILFSISPCGDIDKNYNSLYADVTTWCSCEGFADTIIPQIYYGFENSSQPFEKCLSEWKNTLTNENIKLVIGLAAYKIGKEDAYAGTGKNEWIENDNVIKRQIECVRENKLDGFALFSYNYIFSNSYFKNNEIIGLKEVL